MIHNLTTFKGCCKAYGWLSNNSFSVGDDAVACLYSLPGRRKTFWCCAWETHFLWVLWKERSHSVWEVKARLGLHCTLAGLLCTPSGISQNSCSKSKLLPLFSSPWSCPSCSPHRWPHHLLHHRDSGQAAPLTPTPTAIPLLSSKHIMLSPVFYHNPSVSKKATFPCQGYLLYLTLDTPPPHPFSWEKLFHQLFLVTLSL